MMARAISMVAALFWIAAGARPACAQFIFKGGSNGVLGIYLSTGEILSLNPHTTVALGWTFSYAMGLEPLVGLSVVQPLSRGWTATLATSYGQLGGDYRVDRFPEISLTKAGRILGGALNYGLDVGAGQYRVLPVDVSGYRLHASAELSTPSFALGRLVSTSAAIGYRQYFYPSSFTKVHGAAWGTVRLAATPLPGTAVTLTYLRQNPSGSSPLYFDAIGAESTVTGGVTFRPAQWLTFAHSQSYNFLSNAITARVYGVEVTFPLGHVIGMSWDEVAQTVSLSYQWLGGR